MCRQTITAASCGHDLGWILVQCQRIRDGGADNAHCSDLYIRGAQYIFINGPCGRFVQEAHGHGASSVSNYEEEHEARDDDADSDAIAIADDNLTAKLKCGGLGREMRRLNRPVADEAEECGEPTAKDTYRFRDLSPVPEGAELNESATPSSTPQRQHTAASIDLARRRLVRTVRARRRLRSEDIDGTPSVHSYNAFLRGGAEDGEDFDDGDDYRRVMEDSNRAYQERIRTIINESPELQQEHSAPTEEDEIRRVLEASRREHDVAITAQEEEDIQRLLAASAEDHAALASREEAEIQRLLAQSAQDARAAAEVEESRMLEQTLRLSLEECPPQTEDDFMDEVARATAASAREYTDRYGDYLSPDWKEQYDDFARRGFESSRAGSSGGAAAQPAPPGHNEPDLWIQRGSGYEREDDVVATPTAPRSGTIPKASRSGTQMGNATTRIHTISSLPGPINGETDSRRSARHMEIPPANLPIDVLSASDTDVDALPERPALRRAGPRGPQVLGGSQQPGDAATAAREATLRRHQQSAVTSEREPSESKPNEKTSEADPEEDLVGWWKDAATKS